MKIFKVFVLAVFMVVAVTQTVAAGVIFNSVTFNYEDTSYIRLYFDGVTEVFAGGPDLNRDDVVSSGIYMCCQDAVRYGPDKPVLFFASFHRQDPFGIGVSPEDFQFLINGPIVGTTDTLWGLMHTRVTFGYKVYTELKHDPFGIVWDYDIVSDVPESGSLAMLGLGLAGLGYSRRKSRLQA